MRALLIPGPFLTFSRGVAFRWSDADRHISARHLSDPAAPRSRSSAAANPSQPATSRRSRLAPEQTQPPPAHPRRIGWPERGKVSQTSHTSPPGRARPPIHRHDRHAADSLGGRQGRGADVLRGLHEGRRGREDASGLLSVQRRPRSRDRVAAYGIVRPKARADGGGRISARAALSPRRQRELADRRHRPGVHRRDFDRLQPHRGRRRRRAVPRPTGRSARVRRFHQRVPEDLQPVALAQVPDRRELRHDPVGRPVAGAADAARRRAQRHRPDLVAAHLSDDRAVAAERHRAASRTSRPIRRRRGITRSCRPISPAIWRRP